MRTTVENEDLIPVTDAAVSLRRQYNPVFGAALSLGLLKRRGHFWFINRSALPELARRLGVDLEDETA